MFRKNNISSWSYNAYIDSPELDELKILIFNHGTQSKKNSRTNNHARDCKNCEYPLNYNIINQVEDRLINGKIITGKADPTYAMNVGKELDPDAIFLKNASRLIRNACIEAHLSETECVVIHYTNKEECIAKLQEALIKVDNWYHNDESLLVDIATYDPEPYDTDMSVRPFIVNRKTRRFIEQNINSYKKYDKVLIQGLAAANFVYTKFSNIEYFVVYVSDYDIYYNISIYDEFKTYDNIEFKYYESDNDIKDLYMKENKQDFDIIISNPPYGKIGAKITELINKTRKNDSIFINLLPANDYARDKDLFKYVDLNSMKPVNNGFKDAAVTTHMALINKKPCMYISKEEFEIENYIDDSLKKYFYENVNRKHYALEKFTDIRFHCKDYTNTTTLILGFREVCNKHLPYIKNCSSYKWNVEKSIDSQYLLDNHQKTVNGKSYGEVSFSGITFNTSIEKDNFVKFIYSKDGFRFISKIFTALNKDGGLYMIAFPKVDWSREWAVEEILADYGYSEKEIKEVMDDLVNFKYMED